MGQWARSIWNLPVDTPVYGPAVRNIKFILLFFMWIHLISKEKCSFSAELLNCSRHRKKWEPQRGPLLNLPMCTQLSSKREDILMSSHTHTHILNYTAHLTPGQRAQPPHSTPQICVGYVKRGARSMGKVPGERRCHHTLNSTPGLTKHPLINKQWGKWLNLDPPSLHTSLPPGSPPLTGASPYGEQRRRPVPFCSALGSFMLGSAPWRAPLWRLLCMCVSVCVRVCVCVDSSPGVLSVWVPQ